MAVVGQQFGPYICVRRLGVGGMAETFVGRSLVACGAERRVCVKVMHGVDRSRELRHLFLHEVRTVALLRHANIVSMVDFLEDEGVLVLELVEGADLRAVLGATPGRRLGLDQGLWVGVELCKALRYAHSRTFHGAATGIVHRDLSPTNVLISYAGEVKLTDFGIARPVAEIVDFSSNIRGKVAYMAPEQAAGRAVDGRADLFALGVMLYELFAGRRPFDGCSDGDTARRARSGRYTPLHALAPALPKGLYAVVDRLLCGQPEGRFRDADAVLDALSPFAPGALTFRSLGALAGVARPQGGSGREPCPRRHDGRVAEGGSRTRSITVEPRAEEVAGLAEVSEPVTPRVRGAEPGVKGRERSLTGRRALAWAAVGVALGAWLVRCEGEKLRPGASGARVDQKGQCRCAPPCWPADDGPAAMEPMEVGEARGPQAQCESRVGPVSGRSRWEVSNSSGQGSVFVPRDPRFY